MNDLISRSDAIEAVERALAFHSYAGGIAGRAVMALPSVRPEPQWIPCSERLPKDQRPVIIYVPPDDTYLGYVGMAYYTYSVNGGMWCGTDGNIYGAIGMIRNPSQWMPLPEPYEAESEE